MSSCSRGDLRALDDATESAGKGPGFADSHVLDLNLHHVSRVDALFAQQAVHLPAVW